MVFKKNRSIFGILGNKENDIKFFINYLPSNSLNIVEVFGGSYAVSRCIYYDDKYIKFVNDNDNEIFYLYNHLSEFEEKLNEFNNIAKKYLTDDLKFVDFKKLKDFEEEIKKNCDNEIFIKRFFKDRCIRGNIIKVLKNDTQKNDTLKLKINFSNLDYLDIFQKFKEDETAFLFLDPPYMFSDNGAYEKLALNKKDKKNFIDNKYDNTKMIMDILDLWNDEKTKCKIMLIINKLYFIEKLFNNFLKSSYIKCYNMSKKKETLLIITNY